MILANLIPPQQHSFLEDKANQILDFFKVTELSQINLENFVSNSPKTMLCYMKQKSKTVINQNLSIIIVDSRLDPLTQKIQLAEEYCHTLLHVGNQCTYEASWMLNKQENQAKRMSAYLLCPLQLLKNISIPYDTYFYIDEVAEIFNVPIEFMKYRLELIWEQDLDMVAYVKKKYYGYRSLE